MDDFDRKLSSKTLRMNELSREKSTQEKVRLERVPKEVRSQDRGACGLSSLVLD